MIATLEDRHTSNPDERVDIEIELISMHYRDYRTKVDTLLRSIRDCAKTYPSILRNLYNDKSTDKIFCLLVKDSPFIVVRGAQIPSDKLYFIAQYHEVYVRDPDSYSGTYEYKWEITARNDGSYITPFQAEQLALRYTDAILEIVGDEDLVSIVDQFTTNKIFGVVKETISKQITMAETAIQTIDSILDGDYDVEENGEDNE